MNKILALALNTTREAIRNRVLYSILAFAVLMVGVSAVFGSASIGDQIRYIKDFSLMSISLFAVIIAVVLGVNLLHKELSKKTILNTLSKPVARWQFVLGKFFGLLLTLSAITTGMALGLGVFLAVLEGRFDTAILVAAFASLLETMVVIAFAMFFSSLVVTPTLAGMFTIGCFIAGRSTQYLDYFTSGDLGWPPQVAARVLDAILPRLDNLLIGDRLVHGESVAVSTILFLVGYATAYSTVLLVISAGIFSRREFK